MQWRLPLALATVGPLGLLAALPLVPGECHVPRRSVQTLTGMVDHRIPEIPVLG